MIFIHVQTGQTNSNVKLSGGTKQSEQLMQKR